MMKPAPFFRVLRGLAVISPLFLAACATTGGGNGDVVVSMATTENIPRIGFLSDYSRLKPAPGLDGMLCWRNENIDLKQYDKVLLSPIRVSIQLKKDQETPDPGDIKAMTDYFQQALVKAIQPNAKIVLKPEAGVLVASIALTNLVPTDRVKSMAGTLTPYAFVAEAASGPASGRPAGSTPYMGETGMQARFADGASGAVVAECADIEIGRKYAAALDKGAAGATTAWVGGYVDSFTSWNYAQDAFDKWAAQFAQRFNTLRGVKP